jgi:type I restriction enzyme, S subunit
MSFPRYERYKESRVEWLGEVPEGWNVKSIKWISPVQRGASPRPIDDPKYFDDDGDYAWVRITDVSASDGILRESHQQLSELGSSLSVKLQPGDLFVSIAGTVGKPCITDIRACIHDGFVYFPRLEIEPKFLYRIFEAGVCYQGLGKWGTQLNLNTDTIGSIRIALPPEDELSKILDFLDCETSKIDLLVAEQEQLISLLKEKRQAVISHAVTKGQNPDAPMNDSGIEWLGEVPVGWEIGALKYFVAPSSNSIKTGPFGSQLTSAEMQSGEIKVYNQRNVIDGDLSSGDNYITAHKFKELSAFEVFPGDLLITTRGTIGRTAILPDNAEKGVLHPCLIRVQVDSKKLTNNYLQTLLQDSHLLQTQISVLSNATTIEVIYSDTLASLIIPIPPPDEQFAIVAFLDSETAKIDALMGETRQAINLLKEYRSALISAAVTGKIDVRGTV